MSQYHRKQPLNLEESTSKLFEYVYEAESRHFSENFMGDFGEGHFANVDELKAEMKKHNHIIIDLLYSYAEGDENQFNKFLDGLIGDEGLDYYVK